jgi:hypothetical protein
MMWPQLMSILVLQILVSCRYDRSFIVKFNYPVLIFPRYICPSVGISINATSSFHSSHFLIFPLSMHRLSMYVSIIVLLFHCSFLHHLCLYAASRITWFFASVHIGCCQSCRGCIGQLGWRAHQCPVQCRHHFAQGTITQ